MDSVSSEKVAAKTKMKELKNEKKHTQTRLTKGRKQEVVIHEPQPKTSTKTKAQV